LNVPIFWGISWNKFPILLVGLNLSSGTSYKYNMFVKPCPYSIVSHQLLWSVMCFKLSDFILDELDFLMVAFRHEQCVLGKLCGSFRVLLV
jgi:hypothetical protein